MTASGSENSAPAPENRLMRASRDARGAARQRHAAVADLRERDRRELDGDDAPAEEGEREGRDGPCEAARQNLIGGLRGRHQDEAGQRNRAEPGAVRWRAGFIAAVRSLLARFLGHEATAYPMSDAVRTLKTDR